MKYIFIALTIILSSCSNSPTKTSDNNEYNSAHEKPEFYLGGFNGIWVGDALQIKGHGYPFVAKGDIKLPLMLMIKENDVDIWTSGKADTSFKKINFDKVSIVRHKTNAVIYAQHSESDNLNKEDTGEWVETWNMTITLKTDGSIYLYLVRAVNNFLLSPEINTDEVKARFFYSWSGELNRVAIFEPVDDTESSEITYPENAPLNIVQQAYPPSAYDNNIEGSCIVTFDINISGNTENLRILPDDCKTIDGKTTDIFSEASLNAARQFEFSPQYENGKPIHVRDFTYKFIYRINK